MLSCFFSRDGTCSWEYHSSASRCCFSKARKASSIMRRRACLELLLNFQSIGTGQYPEFLDIATEPEEDRESLFENVRDISKSTYERSVQANALGSKTSLGAHPLARRFCLRRGALEVQDAYCAQDFPGGDHHALLTAYVFCPSLFT